MKRLEGGVTAPKGFMASGIRAGVKKEGRDVALVYSTREANVAATFTTNVVKAAPVVLSQETVGKRPVGRAVVINSGNANACTGDVGLRDAAQMRESVAVGLGIANRDVLVASTGVIGVPLPIETVCAGIRTACAELGETREAGTAAAEAIMTTDTYVKEMAVSVEIDGKTVTVGGMAKGSGMIHPNMATMLAVLTTDGSVDAATLQALLRETVADTYNMISVDGDTSTNDTVFMMANGLAGNDTVTGTHPDYGVFRDAVRYVCTFLAKRIVGDGEGASKLLEVQVSGAATSTDARVLAKSVINSNLVKTAFFGEDANWGRILAAMGYSGASFDAAGVSIAFESAAGRIDLMKAGEPERFDEDVASGILKEREIVIDIHLRDGDGRATAWGCDLSYDYVRINGDYRT
ncbi:bifunctional ornithine acetyltransferase/N-acetylglutamate synthase [Alicyclobacillus dauci]|uniref:Arginine biosynthesis bifunctional protein ArgJ n=1 Tax=Alicyclobacillus dauci TaxID=1475485 RepID=A0ABY6Z4F9_9BACL|nr:bifunctional ornithine acetyltransferase/N-acetylglutamate synthase [Alicyclobacillus dauci]WAH37206.1 bifunctional ornithine acetyltransferase/N-acetylglutamate synthase [Alicyclobacillus dauci]